MKIGFDFRPALKKNSRARGIGRCVVDLLAALLRHDERNQYLVYTLKGEGTSRIPAGRTLERPLPYLRTPSRLNWILERREFARAGKRDRLDLLHINDITSIPSSRTCPLWVTVHDLIPFIFWDRMKDLPRDYRYALRSARDRILTADHVVTSSRHSKADICRLIGNPPEKVHVIPLGFSESIPVLPREEAAGRIRDAFGIGAPFLFYVGGSDYRKNLPFLVRAFARLKREGYRGSLVLAGETFGWSIPEVMSLRRQIAECSLERDVLFPGYVSDRDLGAFYGACEFFVFPSLYEGFGLPVLEAMRCGAPLLITRASSVPEVAGENAFYFSPEDEDDFCSTFWEASEDASRVEEKRRLASQTAGGYTWKRAAERLLKRYEQ